jgi:hypothetical protein
MTVKEECPGPETAGTPIIKKDANPPSDHSTLPISKLEWHGYCSAGLIYWDAGHYGVIQLKGDLADDPREAKTPLKAGFTGNRGRFVTREEVQGWCSPGNSPKVGLGLRLLPWQMGLDIDARDGGDETVREYVEKLGGLPETYRSTARDGLNGILLYEIPAGLKLKGDLGPGVQIVQYHHRHCTAWPTIHPKTRTKYRWFAGDEMMPEGLVPMANALPGLPAAWLDELVTR